MASPRYHHGNLRPALLAAGVRLARERGANALQVRDLASAEGVSPAAVYRHFPDMAHLAAEVSRLAREQLAQGMLDAAGAVPPDTEPGRLAIRRFDAIGRAYVRFAAREPHLFDIAFQAAAAPPSCPDQPSAWGVLTDALDALVAAGELDPALRADAPVVAWSAVHGLANIVVRQLAPDATGGLVDETAGSTAGEAAGDTAGDTAAVDALMRGIKRALGLRDDESPRIGAIQ